MQQELELTLNNFTKSVSPKPKNIVVYGPTASGKSGLAVDIGVSLRSLGYTPFIISADARQIYRGLDIGTGKIRENEMLGIPHALIDIKDPSERFSVVEFRQYVENLELWKEWNSGNKQIIPIICGGTGLYIDSLIFERSYPSIEADWDLRDELEKYRIENGNEALWKKLHDIDPEYANELHPNNYHYVIRGIEVMTKTGNSKVEIQDSPTLKYDTLFFTPYHETPLRDISGKIPPERQALYTRIDARVEKMFDYGLIEEVGYNIDTFTSSAPGLRTIGYKEVVDYLEGRISLDVCKDLVKQHNRNYAKRQITWNKKYGHT